MMLIGLHGKAGVGKDTFADRLVEKYGFAKRGFADPLYEEVADAFSVTVEWLKDRARKEVAQDELALVRCGDGYFRRIMICLGNDSLARYYEPHSPRWVLQQWGTEYRRARNENYWINKMMHFARGMAGIAGAPGLVVPDCRFENEAGMIRGMGGLVVQILRDVPGVAAHASETPLPSSMINFRVYNYADVNGLLNAADYFLARAYIKAAGAAPIA